MIKSAFVCLSIGIGIVIVIVKMLQFMGKRIEMSFNRITFLFIQKCYARIPHTSDMLTANIEISRGTYTDVGKLNLA